MSRWRIAVMAILIIGPFAFLAAVGSYYVWWEKPWGWPVWVPMTVCMALGWFLGWYWQRKKVLLRPMAFQASPHHTERDAKAWKVVEARALAATKIDPDKLVDPQFYLAEAQAMAQELAVFYHPTAKDPVGNLTIPEILAVVELASHDLAELVDKYLPGGHLLTVNDWKRARKLMDWYNYGSNAYWIISALFSPINTAFRYTASQIGLSTPLQMLQTNLLQWFYAAFVHRMGHYLIDLHSGRLALGATRYRELVTGRRAPAGADGEPAEDVRQVTVTLMGQVKAGKSSLVNALLGENKAKTDVLPATADVDRHEFQPEDVPTRLVLLDTVGYGHEGPKADQVKATREAAKTSDLLLLVLHARNPARKADVEMLAGLRSWFASKPDLKMPPVVAVLTHIDLLSPSMEWSPPYNWSKPRRPKEQSIHDALVAAFEQLGELAPLTVPVCTAAGRVYGVDEFLLPVVADLLDEVHGVALLRCLRAEKDAGKIRRVFHQMLAAGKGIAQILWESAKQKVGGGAG
jgi:predicted GTPase